MRAAVVRHGGSGTAIRTRRLPRPVVQQLQVIEQQGLATAAEVQAAAYVTHTALRLTAVLTAEEGRLVSLCPLGEARYRLLVDQFAGVSAAIVGRYGW